MENKRKYHQERMRSHIFIYNTVNGVPTYSVESSKKSTLDWHEIDKRNEEGETKEDVSNIRIFSPKEAGRLHGLISIFLISE
jgi:hypothetical protein